MSLSELAPVTSEDVARARAHGATDLETHDTVFCLCSGYVDGLAASAPDDAEFYREGVGHHRRTRVRGRHHRAARVRTHGRI